MLVQIAEGRSTSLLQQRYENKFLPLHIKQFSSQRTLVFEQNVVALKCHWKPLKHHCCQEQVAQHLIGAFKRRSALSHIFCRVAVEIVLISTSAAGTDNFTRTDISG